MTWLALLLISASLLSPGSEACSDLEAAHRAFLDSAFTAERHFTVIMNDKLKVREVVRLNYAKGELTTETVEKEVFDKNIELDPGNGELSIQIPFDCERVTQIAAGQFKLMSADGKDSVVFFFDRERGMLKPLSWESTDKTRFLWKKYVILATAELKDFEWR